MALPNIFTKDVSDHVIARINALKPDTQPGWGKMDVAQMLAHCCVAYEMTFEDNHPKPNFLMKWILKTFIKNGVTSETPYKRNAQTAPAFLIKGSRDFETEKRRLIGYIRKTHELGEAGFEGRASHSFGVLTIPEWNNMFYKHVDHHLNQFGV
ncbi:DUF1569 domain-containing protein [Dyadobacter bucti]|uniref:DUF1569 domain-containing protein n=1 Tax=Dyadobacter bucti TaxID=2572203 RepID=UPI0011081B07|nr:DUF1569 domain-containing protein [Dyadobacter bucti]